MRTSTSGAWPAHAKERLPWAQRVRGGTREDRMLTAIEASVPPSIATLDLTVSPRLAALSERAIIAAAQADAAAVDHTAALARFLVRSESVASSKIERITASALDYARAIAGSKGNESAVSMVAAATAMQTLVDRATEAPLSLDDLLLAHRALMEDDPQEAAYAGRIRDMQNWVGGSDHSPRGALHVPPAPARVAMLLDDLLEYLERDDVPVLTQAAIAHAQFESIHPFTDGNGRIGRAMVSAVFRRRGVTRRTVVPLASGILARRDEYFDALGRYRAGDPEPIVDLFARSALAGSLEARTTITRIIALPANWAERIPSREGSTARALIEAFFQHPVLTASEVADVSGAGTSQTATVLRALEDAGVIREITGRKRDRAWVADDLMTELDDLDVRIQAAMRDAAD